MDKEKLQLMKIFIRLMDDPRQPEVWMSEEGWDTYHWLYMEYLDYLDEKEKWVTRLKQFRQHKKRTQSITPSPQQLKIFGFFNG